MESWPSDGLTARIDNFERQLTARIDAMATQLSADIADARRHADVQFERVRNDLRALAEAIAVIGAKLDRLSR